MNNIKPTATGVPQVVRVEVQITDNGLFSVTSPSIVENEGKEPKTQPSATLPLEGITHGRNEADLESYRSQEVRIGV